MLASAVESEDPFGLIGAVLDRKYRIDRVVAEGGFGVVFAGHHLALDTPVAVKVLKLSASTGPSYTEALARFLTEAKTLARLRHPHIVSVLDSGVHETDAGRSLPWIVFEWLAGETLRAHLDGRRGQGGRSKQACLQLMRPVLEAIAYAHAQGFAHRDIKPSNIMLLRSPGGLVPQVLDFGIAKAMESEELAGSGETRTRGNARAFSPRYAAPEQISGARTGPWTDVHALGLVLSEVLTDKPAYPSEDSTEICRDVFDAERPTPGHLGVDVGDWEPILARALALKPAERFPDAAVLLSKLDGSLNGKAEVPVEDTADASKRSMVVHGGTTSQSSAAASADQTFSTLVTGAPVPRRRSPWQRRTRFGVALGALALVGGLLLMQHDWQRAPELGRAKASPENVAAPASMDGSKHDATQAASVDIPVPVNVPVPLPVNVPGPEARGSDPTAPSRSVAPARGASTFPHAAGSAAPRIAPTAPATAAFSAAPAPPASAMKSSKFPAPYVLE